MTQNEMNRPGQLEDTQLDDAQGGALAGIHDLARLSQLKASSASQDAMNTANDVEANMAKQSQLRGVSQSMTGGHSSSTMTKAAGKRSLF